MAHEQKISQTKPALVGLIVDDSGSAADNLAGTSNPRFEWIERYVGIILQLLLSRSSEIKGNGVVIKPRYYLTVVKYGSAPEIWGSPEMDIQTAAELFSNSGQSLGLGGHLGGTNAAEAFEEMHGHIKTSLAGERFKDSFPPMVYHLTDGESHSDASPVAQEIMQLSTNDGHALLVNVYIGTQTSLNYQGPEDFPGYLNASEAGPSEDNLRLFNMSSVTPECMEMNLKLENIFPELRSGSRLFFDVRTKEMLKHAIQVIGSMGSRMAR
jgi:hypothetical protein